MRQHAPEFDSGWVGADPDDDLDERMAFEDEEWDRDQPHVATVLGPVSPAALGPVLAGEPLAILAGRSQGDATGTLDGRHELLAELEDAYASGVRTVVATPLGFGHGSGNEAVWLAGRSQVHVVRLGTDDAMMAGVDPLPEAWGGIAVPSGDRTRVESAAAWSVAVACPLRILAGNAGAGARAAEWAATVGVPIGRLSVGDCDWFADRAAAAAAVAAGASIVLPAGRWGDTSAFADGVARLVSEGFGDRLLVTTGLDRPEALLARGGQRGLGWMMERIPLALMDAGLDALAVRRILVDNPARTLTIGPGE